MRPSNLVCPDFVRLNVENVVVKVLLASPGEEAAIYMFESHNATLGKHQPAITTVKDIPLLACCYKAFIANVDLNVGAIHRVELGRPILTV
jgi:hypothetical protein